MQCVKFDTIVSKCLYLSDHICNQSYSNLSPDKIYSAFTEFLWPFGIFVCKLFTGLFYLGMYSMTFFIAALSIDRYQLNFSYDYTKFTDIYVQVYYSVFTSNLQEADD